MGIQVHVGNKPTPEEFLFPQANPNLWRAKPARGLWTSTLLGGGYSSWQAFDPDANLTSSNDGWLLEPSKTSKILLICNQQDHEAIAKQYPCKDEQELAFHDLIREIFKDNAPIDFEALFKDFDGLRFVPDKRDWESFDSGLIPWGAHNGWDIESTCWGKWCFDAVTPQPAVELPRYC